MNDASQTQGNPSFKFIGDGKFGWLLIDPDKLDQVGLKRHAITDDSRISPDGTILALGEDGAAKSFLDAWTAQFTAPAFEDIMLEPCEIRDWPALSIVQNPSLEHAAQHDKSGA